VPGGRLERSSTWVQKNYKGLLNAAVVPGGGDIVRVNQPNLVSQVASLRKDASKALGLGKGAEANKPDRVSLSDEVAKMRAVEGARINALKQAIAEGHYEVDLDRLATAFVKAERP